MLRSILTTLVIVVSFMSFQGCTEQPTEVQDTTFFEKRTPISTKDSLNRPPIDSLKRRMPLQSALPCLSLTREQRKVVDSFLVEAKKCERACKEVYSRKAKAIHDSTRIKLQEFRGLEKDSTIRLKMRQIQAQSQKLALEAKKEFQECIKSCNSKLFESIEAILTKEQLTLWNIWKVTGRIPCEVTKP